MRRKIRRLWLPILVIFMILMGSVQVFAHSGRTDGSGGHRDNNNASGLGSYHFHHGVGPHLHNDGICPYSPKDTIKVNNMPNSLVVGEFADLDWVVTYYSGNDDVEWSSSDSSIISVTESGEIKAHNVGNAIITAKLYNGLKKFTVTCKEIKAEKIQIVTKISEISIGNSKTLSSVIEPKNTTNKEITWSSSNSDVATIDNSGKITPLKAGGTTIRVKTSNGLSDNLELKVFEIKPEKIETDVNTLKLIIGETSKINAHVLPMGVVNVKITWSVLDSNIATVDSAGRVDSLGIGKTSIIAAFQDITTEIQVEVLPIETQSISVSSNNIPYKISNIIGVGGSFAPEVDIYPENATNQTYELLTDNPDVLSIIGNNVEVIHSGTATLTIKSGEVKTDISFRAVNLNFIYTSGIIGLSVIGIAIFKIKNIKKKQYKKE